MVEKDQIKARIGDTDDHRPEQGCFQGRVDMWPCLQASPSQTDTAGQILDE